MTEKRIDLDESNSISDIDELLASAETHRVSTKHMRGARHFRYYRIVAESADEKFQMDDIPQNTLRSKVANLRGQGYHVNIFEMVEEGTGTKVEAVIDLDGGKGVPNPIPIDSYRMRQKTKKAAPKKVPYEITRFRDNVIRVYHHGNLAIANTDFVAVVTQIQKLEECGRWKKNDWVIYLPKPIYEMVMGIANGTS